MSFNTPTESSFKKKKKNEQQAKHFKKVVHIMCKKDITKKTSIKPLCSAVPS